MYTFTFTPEEKSKSNNASLSLGGDLNLLNIKSIEKDIRNIPFNYSSYDININKVTDLDIPFLQLLHSFLFSLSNEKKDIDLQIDLPEEYRELLVNSGIDNIIRITKI